MHLIIMALLMLTALSSAVPLNSLDNLVYICPSAGAEWQSTETRIILGFDGAPPPGLHGELHGTLSGQVPYGTYTSEDGQRVVLTPLHPFQHGETVSVLLEAPGSGGVQWIFAVRPTDPELPFPVIQATEYPDRSYPYLRHPTGGTASGAVALPADFPQITFNTYGSTAPGNLFFSPMNPIGANNSTYLVIADNSGDVLFYIHSHHPFFNVEVQSDGCLSYITGPMAGQDVFWIELDESYSLVDSFAVIGYPTDIHDFTVARNGNLLLMGVDLRYIDMSQVVPGGDPNALVAGLLIQEQDRNHMPVFQWTSFDHFEITDACSYVNLTGSYVDYVHCNSIDEDQDGGLIVSCLAMTECTKIHRMTGDLVWRFGGYLSENPSFTILNDPLGGFSSQHDFRNVSGNLYSVFDNGTHHSPKISRACIYELDMSEMTAELVWGFQIAGLYGSHMGSTQSLPNGNVLIGWGDVTGFQARPDITEATPAGTVVFSGRMDQLLLESYRSYRFDWIGQALLPYLVALVLPAQSCVQLTYNVFGEAEYSSYDIYQGTTPGNLVFLTNTPLKQINVWDLPQGMNYFAVKARDAQGTPTGFSNTDSAMVTWTGIQGDHFAGPMEGNRISVFPCPALSQITVTWPGNTGAGSLVQIYDTAGRTVLSETLSGNTGTGSSLVIPVEGMPAGVYMLSVRSGDYFATSRVVILR